MAEHAGHALQGRQVGIKVSVEVATDPFLVAVDLLGKRDLGGSGRAEPLANLLTRDIIDGRRRHGGHGLNDNQILSHSAPDYTISV